MSPDTDLALRGLLKALTELVNLATESVKRDLAQEETKRVK